MTTAMTTSPIAAQMIWGPTIAKVSSWLM